MKPLILQYLEKPVRGNFNASLLEYDEKLNLTIDKKTRKPAISYLNLETETFTKTFSEESDSDRDNNMAIYMGTVTQTFTQLEGSDDDNDLRMIKQMMSTRTITESVETADSDK